MKTTSEEWIMLDELLLAIVEQRPLSEYHRAFAKAYRRKMQSAPPF